jgi:predicted deacylase
MQETLIDIPGRAPGTTHHLHVCSFGHAAARPHVHVQGGLHADEGPGMMAARQLIDQLQRAEAEGRITGRITVVPAANPLGLGQVVQGEVSGRFDLYDGRNFNRDYPDLTSAAAETLAGQLTDDPAHNTGLVRTALDAALAAWEVSGPADSLRQHLLALGLAADVVLDLHCDSEAVMHLYTQPSSVAPLAPLIALTGCRAVLLADVSGGNPFDEALSRPWAELAARFPDRPIPPGCISCTLELRGQADVSRALGAVDAEALMGFLAHHGVLDRPAPDLPAMLCDPTPLSGSETLVAPVPGLLSYFVEPGQTVAAGAVIADITCPLTGAVTPLAARTSGVLFARAATRVAERGKRLGKIAGRTPLRDGLLLGP